MRGLKLTFCGALILFMLWLALRLMLGPMGAMASPDSRAFGAVVALGMIVMLALLGVKVMAEP